MPFVWPCGREHPFILKGCDDVFIASESILSVLFSQGRLKSSRDHYSPYIKAEVLRFLLVVDCLGGTYLAAYPALTLGQVKTVFRVNRVLKRYCLGKREESGFTGLEFSVKCVNDLLGTFFSAFSACDAFVFFDVSWLFFYKDLKVARRAFKRNDLRAGLYLYIDILSNLDKFR